ncbi:hypothetical protein [Noviherbaspirillum saxi]|uniref:hypothetical protein n=1 Tax=Noviherbaspirillum saxi TaxID=2320863 RepID=UPI001313EECF|nr:hypothetical protein [Noviherbaspirillum saxi]
MPVQHKVDVGRGFGPETWQQIGVAWFMQCIIHLERRAIIHIYPAVAGTDPYRFENGLPDTSVDRLKKIGRGKEPSRHASWID